MTILNLLQVLDNPIQDIPLLSVLHSPIYHFTAEELMQIRMMSENKEDNYYDCAQKCIQEYEQKYNTAKYEKRLQKRLKMVFDNISDWRKKARESSISQLLWYLYSETDILDYVGVTAGGKIKTSKFTIFNQKAEEYEKTSLKGLFHFVRYIENIKKQKILLVQQNYSMKEKNMVRIMTIHKSKGLEFPVVFVSDMGKNFQYK